MRREPEPRAASDAPPPVASSCCRGRARRGRARAGRRGTLRAAPLASWFRERRARARRSGRRACGDSRRRAPRGLAALARPTRRVSPTSRGACSSAQVARIRRSRRTKRPALPSYALCDYARAGKARALLGLGRAARRTRGSPSHRRRSGACADAARVFSPTPRTRRVNETPPSSLGEPPCSTRRAPRTLVGEPQARGGVARCVSSADGGLPNVPSPETALDALRLVRRVAAEAAGSDEIARRASELGARALELLPTGRARPERVAGRRRRSRAREGARGSAPLRGGAAPRRTGARAAFARRADAASSAATSSYRRAKAHAGEREWAKARSAAAEAAKRCENDADRHARALFLAGKYAVSERSFLPAAQIFERLEAEHPKNSLADDARLSAALAYRELGIGARFTELLSTMPEDYPEGDMIVEGLFRLAVDRVDRSDWSGAASVLARATALVGDKDADRGLELAGRERYFAARAELALGRREQRACRVRDASSRARPFSYYMLNAYSRLAALDAARAKRARERGFERAQQTPRPVASSEALARPGHAAGSRALAGRRHTRCRRRARSGGTGEGGRGTRSAVGSGDRVRSCRRVQARPRHRALPPHGLAVALAYRRLGGRVARRVPASVSRARRAERRSQKLPQSLVFAIMREESAFDPGSRKSSRAPTASCSSSCRRPASPPRVPICRTTAARSSDRASTSSSAVGRWRDFRAYFPRIRCSRFPHTTRVRRA